MDAVNRKLAAKVGLDLWVDKQRKERVDKDGKAPPLLWEAVTMALQQKELNQTKGYEGAPDNATILKGHEDLVTETRKRLDSMYTELNSITSDLQEKDWIPYRQHFMAQMWASKDGIPMADLPLRLREETGHVKEQRIPSYQEGIAMGLQPITLDAGEILKMYAREMFEVATTKSVLHTMMDYMNPDGRPYVIGVPAGGDHMAKFPADPTAHETQEQYAERIGTRLASFLGAKDKDAWQKKYIGQPLGGLAAMIRGKGATPEAVDMTSPYKSWQKFLVHPDAVSTMDIILNSKWDNKFMRAMDHYNAFSKGVGLSLSMFHYGAGVENFWSLLAHRIGNEKAVSLREAFQGAFNGKLIEKMRNDPELVETSVRAGLSYQGTSDMQTGLIDKDLEAIHKAVEHIPGAKQVVEGVQKLNDWNNKKLWNDLFGGMSLHAFNELRKAAVEHDPSLLTDPARRFQSDKEIANVINSIKGDIPWSKFMWATPKARQLMNLAIFAPRWTVSNIVNAGLGGALGYKYTKYEMRMLATKYWPAMLGTIIVLPQAIQAAIYTAFGSRDKDDEPFSIDNEQDKHFSIDISPITRHLGFGGLTGKDRYYLRYGKSAWEIAGLMENPLTTLMSKTSMAFKQVFEQATGSNVSGWDLPYKGEGFWRSVADGDRAKGFAKQFVPMSLSSLAEGKPSSFFAPVSRGMTAAKAERLIGDALATYASPETWDKIQGKPDYQKNLAGLVPQILDAAQRNGIDPAIVLAQGKRYVISNSYNDFFKAINDNDLPRAERWAQSVIRLHGAFKGMEQSMHKKYERAGLKEGTPEEKQSAIQQVMQSAQEHLQTGQPPV